MRDYSVGSVEDGKDGLKGGEGVIMDGKVRRLESNVI